MTRPRVLHRCTACSATFSRWSGRCSLCGAWNTLVEEETTRPPATRSDPDWTTAGIGAPAAVAQISYNAPVPLSAVAADAGIPRPTGVGELDRVLGGGLAPGSVTLLSGEPGIGKSTLVFQLAAGSAERGSAVLLVSGEETAAQIRRRADRLGGAPGGLDLLVSSCLDDTLAACDASPPDLLVVDSIQTMAEHRAANQRGSVQQVLACAHHLVHFAKAFGMATVIVGQVTKDGSPAGPRQLEHLVDTVLTFEGDRHHDLRLLSVLKHRFGATGELGVMTMTGAGLRAVSDPSALLLADRRPGIAGTVVVPVLEGRRALLAELQTLVTPSTLGTPRRAVQGVPASRLAMVVAVLEQRAGCQLASMDLFTSVAGGLRVQEPAADLALALALSSARTGVPLGEHLVACGEVGLGGEVRQVAYLDRRLAEAARLGFTAAVVPESAPDGPPGMRMLRVATLAEATALLVA
jgi:DNA repair protein RadA/Sms